MTESDDHHAGIRAMLRLSMTPGIGPILIARLRERFGSAQAILEAPLTHLQQVQGISAEKARAIQRGVDEGEIDVELAEAEARGVAAVSIDDAAYPPLLKQIPDPPPVIYVRGSIAPTDVYSIAIVGTRNCSAYGRDQAGRLASALATRGLAIISGGARGIDTEAHRGAMRGGGRTLIVMGCGLSHHYPPENESLFESVVAEGRGALISEFPMRLGPSKENFPRRNRIISGLSLGTLVIEAGERSGALITARLACEEHHREVFAIPGNVDSPRASGCHKIIREGWAKLVTGAADILESLEGSEHLVAGAMQQAGIDNRDSLFATPADSHAPTKVKSTPIGELNLTPSQQKILAALDGQPVELDELSARTGLAIHALQADLTMLQIRGLVARAGLSAVERRR
ncbi:MAG: DNA-protecting protein DprA [Phycisphaerales bacterium]|nr:DNA-protecting protein DprA [Phycisphaerales bacterium]